MRSERLLGRSMKLAFLKYACFTYKAAEEHANLQVKWTKIFQVKKKNPTVMFQMIFIYCISKLSTVLICYLRNELKFKLTIPL